MGFTLPDIIFFDNDFMFLMELKYDKKCLKTQHFYRQRMFMEQTAKAINYCVPIICHKDNSKKYAEIIFINSPHRQPVLRDMWNREVMNVK